MTFIRNIFKNSHSETDGNFFLTIQKLVGFKPKNKKLFIRAFTHRSMNIKDDDGSPFNYERLEFVGDAMLGSVVASYLYNEVPHGDEGYLTKMRSKIVSRQHLNDLGKAFSLIDLVKSNIPKHHFGENIYGNLFEALVGAIYLDQGFRRCEKFIYQKIIIPHVDIERLEGKVISYKSLFIEWCQKEKHSFNYHVFEDSGKEVSKYFAVKLSLNDKVIAKARDTSKKKAEEKASKRAYFAFQKQMQ